MRRLLVLILMLVMVISPLALIAQQDGSFAAQTQTVHVVRYGDTLYSIARYYGVTADAIAAANGIYNYNLIYVGQQLLIPTGYYPPNPVYISYYVRSGDTLARIARYYGTTVAAIAQVNGITNINRIYVGQLLYVPTGGTQPPAQVITYYVAYGDTLGRIARNYGVSVQSIVAYNGILNPNRIYAGMVLYIPVYW